MKYCTQCGHANDDDALFCEKDGCRLDNPVEDIQSKDTKTQVCEKCGFENGMDMKFCGKCGFPLSKISSEKKEGNNGCLFAMLLPPVIFVAVILYLVASNSPDLFEKGTYLNVICYHSKEIDMDGETINLSIDTDADWLKIKDINIWVDGMMWETDRYDMRHVDYHYKISGYENYAKEPVVNIELVDDRSFRITVDKNRGYNRCFTIKVEDSKERFFSRTFFTQDGYKGICVVKR